MAHYRFTTPLPSSHASMGTSTLMTPSYMPSSPPTRSNSNINGQRRASSTSPVGSKRTPPLPRRSSSGRTSKGRNGSGKSENHMRSFSLDLDKLNFPIFGSSDAESSGDEAPKKNKAQPNLEEKMQNLKIDAAKPKNKINEIIKQVAGDATQLDEPSLITHQIAADAEEYIASDDSDDDDSHLLSRRGDDDERDDFDDDPFFNNDEDSVIRHDVQGQQEDEPEGTMSVGGPEDFTKNMDVYFDLMDKGLLKGVKDMKKLRIGEDGKLMGLEGNLEDGAPLQIASSASEEDAPKVVEKDAQNVPDQHLGQSATSTATNATMKKVIARSPTVEDADETNGASVLRPPLTPPPKSPKRSPVSKRKAEPSAKKAEQKPISNATPSREGNKSEGKISVSDSNDKQIPAVQIEQAEDPEIDDDDDLSDLHPVDSSSTPSQIFNRRPSFDTTRSFRGFSARGGLILDDLDRMSTNMSVNGDHNLIEIERHIRELETTVANRDRTSLEKSQWIEQLELRIAELEATVAQRGEKIQALEDDVAQRDEENLEMDEFIRRLEDDGNAREDEISARDDEIEAWEKKFRDLEASFKKQVTDALEKSKKIAELEAKLSGQPASGRTDAGLVKQLENEKAELEKSGYQKDQTIEKLEKDGLAQAAQLVDKDRALEEKAIELERKTQELENMQAQLSALRKNFEDTVAKAQANEELAAVSASSQQTIDKLTNDVESLEHSLEAAHTQIRNLDATLNLTHGDIEAHQDYIQELESEAVEHRQKMETMQTKVSESVTQVTESRIESIRLRRVLEEKEEALTSGNSKVTTLEAELADSRKEVETLKHTIDNAAAKPHAENHQDSAALAAMTKAKSELEQQVVTQASKIAELESRLAPTKTELQKATKSASSMTLELQKSTQRIAELEKELQATTKKIKEPKKQKPESDLPSPKLLSSALQNLHTAYQTSQSTLSTLESKLKKRETDLSNLQTQFTALKEERDTLKQSNTADLTALKTKLHTLQTERAMLLRRETELGTLQERFEALQRERDIMGRALMISWGEKEVGDVKGSVKDANGVKTGKKGQGYRCVYVR